MKPVKELKMPSFLDLALAVRTGKLKLADVPEKVRPRVQKALRRLVDAMGLPIPTGG